MQFSGNTKYDICWEECCTQYGTVVVVGDIQCGLISSFLGTGCFETHPSKSNFKSWDFPFVPSPQVLEESISCAWQLSLKYWVFLS